MTQALAIASEKLLDQVDQLLDEARETHQEAMSRFAELGSKLLTVRETQAWKTRDFKSFGDYLKYAEQRFNLGRTSLYHYISVSEKLLPMVGEETLSQIGISKAGELNRFVKETGKNPPQELIDRAADPETSVKEIREAVFTYVDKKPDDRVYVDLGAVFCTPEERQELRAGYDHVLKILDLPAEYSESAKRKEIQLALVREFYSSYPEGK